MKTKTSLTILFVLIGALLYSQNSFTPPYNLQYQIENNNVNLSWSPPDTINNFYLSWDNGSNGNAIGYTVAATFSVAARWEAAQLAEHEGTSIVKTAFFFTGPESTYTLKVWKGANAETLIYSQEIINPVVNDWGNVYLNNPVLIDVSDDLWVGYEVSHPEGDFPAGTDSGPAISGYGDMVLYDNSWISLATLGLDLNWNIRAYLSEVDGSTNAPLIALNSKKTATTDKASLQAVKTSGKNFTLTPESIDAFLGYNVFKNGVLIIATPIADTAITDFSVNPGIYQYGVSAVYENGESQAAVIEVQVGNPILTIEPNEISEILSPNTTTQIILTIINEGEVALDWDISPTPDWLIPFVSNGIVQPGEAWDLQIFIDTYNMFAGQYLSQLDFNTNSTSTPLVAVPVNLVVIGGPAISVNPEELSFGDVNFGSNVTRAIGISNIGTDTLFINALESTNLAFEIGDSLDFILPGNSKTLLIEFTPVELGFAEGELIVNSNDEIRPELIVPLSANSLLGAPAYLLASEDENDVELNWQMAVIGEGEWLHWDSGENFDAIGYSGAATFQYAARFTPEYLAPYAGRIAPKVSFFPRGENSTYTLKVWQGENASVNIISQPILSFDLDQWNEVYFQTPFQIDPTQELWVGFEVQHPDGDFPAGVDQGPAVNEFGDMIFFDNQWISMGATFGLNYNWNIQLFILENDNSPQAFALEPTFEDNNPLPASGSLSLGKLGKAQKGMHPAMNPAIELLGFNVYKNDVKLNSNLLTEEFYIDQNPEFGSYVYGVTAVYPEGESQQTQTSFQVGAPVMTLNPGSISDTLNAGSISSHLIQISNTGNIDLEWNAEPGTAWIAIDEPTGLLASGESTEITVTLNASGLFGGFNSGFIDFETNNLNNPVTTLGIDLFVNGSGQLILSPDTLDFGITAINTSKTGYINIFNAGNEATYITDMTMSSSEFSMSGFPVYLLPGGSITLGIVFAPGSIGDFTGTFTVFTDDPDNPEYSSILMGSSQLPTPVNLTANVDTNSVFIDWQQPLGGPGNYLQYSGDQAFTAIGYPDGGTFAVAAKFGPDQLMNFNGNAISSIGFIPWTENAEYTLKVWMGENAEDLMLEQIIEAVDVQSWNDIVLDMQIPVDSSSYIWLGYEVVQQMGEFPAGCDFGPAAAGFGDLISTDGTSWESLTYYGLNYNWSIRGFVDVEGENLVLSAVPGQNTKYENSGQPKQMEAELSKEMLLKNGATTYSFLGYNLYRNGVLQNESELLGLSEYQDNNLLPGIYSYEVTAVYDLGESMPAGPLELEILEPFSLPLGWVHQHTAMTHVIHIPTSNIAASSFMSDGDWIGVFYNDNGIEKSAGALRWNTSDSLKMIAFGDDPSSAEKEGFALGEWIKWKVFMAETGDEYELTTSYNPMMPQWDGMFAMLGRSALTDIALLPTSFTELDNNTLRLYPNPTSSGFTLDGIDAYQDLKIYNSFGQELLQLSLNGESKIRLDAKLKPGIYQLVLEGETTKVKKLLVK